MEWLEPWSSTEGLPQELHDSFREQLKREVGPGHAMYGLPVGLIARGHGDEALFEILDGSGQVVDVHLTWGKPQERMPWLWATIYRSFDEWAATGMVRDHNDWVREA